MKRVFCMLLVAAMLLSFLPAVSLQAAAAGDIGIEYVSLSGLPEEMVPGTAQIPQVAVLEGEAEVTQVEWRINEMDAVTTLLPDQAYFLAVTLEPKDGHYFEEWLEIAADREAYMSTYEDGQRRTVFYRYSLLEDAGEIKVWINEPYEGMDIAELTCTVQGNATLKSISVYDHKTGQMLEEGVFETLNNYQITYALEAKPGYEFQNHGDLEVNDGEADVEWSAEGKEMFFTVYFSTCRPIESVEMTLPEIEPGLELTDAVLAVSPDAPYTLTEYHFYSEQLGDEDWDTFEGGVNYELSYHLEAKEGYAFTNEILGYINGEAVILWTYDAGQRANGWTGFSFCVNNIYLNDLPGQIEPGAVQLPTPEVGDEVKITDVVWVDEAKQPVTAFEDGQVYYLAITLEAAENRAFGEEPDIYADGVGEITFAPLTNKQAVIYIRYSLEALAGDVAFDITGVTAGNRLDAVEVAVQGNVILESVMVYEYIPLGTDSYTLEIPQSEVFESGKLYQVSCGLVPKAGYRFSGDFVVTVNGEVHDNWGGGDSNLRVYATFHTCRELAAAALTMPEIKLGAKFTQLQAEVPAGANYTVETKWYDVTDGWNEATGKVEEGHRYEVEFQLQSKEGYVFAPDMAATLNGKPLDVGVQQPGLYAFGWLETSFQKAITKVELPAMPTSIQKNKTLPVATVSGKNYTLTAFWGLADGDEKTVADEDGIYLLVWSVEVKAGYEFTDDTRFYIGGKEIRPLERGWRDAQFIQSYSLGIPTVDRVDLICQEPQVGQEPPEVTVPDDASYFLAMVSWGQSATDDWYDIEDAAGVLQGGLRTYASGMIAVEEGMALDTNVTFYIGGQKMTPAALYNMGQYAIVLFDLGILGQMTQLEAPAVTLTEKTLSWAAAPNAVGYEVYRATSKSGKYTKVATVTETDWTDSVAAGKTYYYKVKAIAADSKYSSGYSNVVSIVYKCDAPVIEVENGDTGKPVVSWEKVSGAKKYTVYRATAVDGKYTKLGTTTKLTYTDSKAKSGVEYFYKVIANASSSTYNSGYSNIYMCYVICGTPSVTAKADAATGKPSISWQKIEGAVGYAILRQLPGEEAFVEIATQTGVTFLDTTAPIDTLCTYRVQALGQQEMLNGAYSNIVTVTSGIARPAVQASVDSVSGKPVFTWEAVEGAVKYEIYRSTKSTKSYSLLTTVEGTSYADESVAAGKTYYYKVVAIGQVGKSAETAYVKLTGKCAVPAITVENGSSGKPVISWEKIAGAKKYTVYRATSETGKYSKLGTTTKLTYTDSKAKSGTEYFYKIIANASSSKYNSGYSNIEACNVICATPAVTLKIDTATGKPSLSWQKIDGAVSYRIFRQLPGEETFVEIANQTGVTFLDTTAPIDTVCQYYVQAAGAHALLDGACSQVVTATSGIAQPKLQSGINSEGKPRFNWQIVEGAVKYEIYRSTKSTKGYSLLATVTDGNAYIDETVAPGKTYYYKVVAIGEVSKSAESAYVKLTGKCAAPWISVDLHETSGKPVLSWEKISGAKKYTVYRATSMEGKYTKLGTTTKLTYTDSKAVPGTEYYYKVVANGSKSSYDSNYSNVKMAVGYAAQPQMTLKNDSKGKPVVSWKSISEAEKYIVVYVDITDVENESDLTEQFVRDNLQYVEVSKKKTSVTLTQAQTGRIYMVCVVAMPKNEEFFAISQIGYVAATCAAPKISGKYIQGYNCGIWKAVEGAEYYAIYRSTKASGEYVLLGYIDNDSSFVDLSAVKGKTYYYKVTACTEYTESEFSNYIKLKTK